MIYFTSDLHFGHANVIQYCNRPYTSVDEMNEMLVKEWNDIVKPNDIVYCLGDFSLSIEAVKRYTPRLMGVKLLIPGNHDWCFPSHKKAKGDKMETQLAIYKAAGWNVLPIHDALDIVDIGTVNMSHLPYKGDSTDDRYTHRRLEDDGKILLCGHVHEKWQTKFTPLRTLMVNVGVDVWNQKPISMDTLKATISSALKNKDSSSENS